jgi:hypothetical protein
MHGRCSRRAALIEGVAFLFGGGGDSCLLAESPSEPNLLKSRGVPSLETPYS